MKLSLWKKASPNRIEIIDGLRGLSILLMVAYHFGYDLVAFCGAPEGLIYNPLLDTLQPLFAGLFILLSGVSCNFSRHNFIRGLEMFAAGWVVTAVTWYMSSPAWFGILHFLGAAAMLYGVYGAAKSALMRWRVRPSGIVGGNASAIGIIQGCDSPGEGDGTDSESGSSTRRRDLGRIGLIALCAILYVISGYYVNSRYFDIPGLWWLGLRQQGFGSSDYFPLLPWIFVYLAGVTAGKWVVEKRLPARFYTLRVPFFAAVGRNTLTVYLAHQPVLYFVTQVILLVTGS